MRRLLVVLGLGAAGVSLFLSACYERPMASAATDNPNVGISRLFTHEGVSVYRFIDAGRPVYFTVPSVPVESGVPCGKQTCSQYTIPLSPQGIPR